MKQLLVLSGKGGTGKTTIASGIIHASHTRTFCDCDVDAPNLHLLTSFATRPRTSHYYGLPKAVIDETTCTQCGLCTTHCRFQAILQREGSLLIDPFACEGCSLCKEVCPTGAIKMRDTVAGETLLYKEEDSLFSTAMLFMGNGTTGKLVTKVKKALQDEIVHLESTFRKEDVLIIDGSPGIGCPVIASITGVDMVLLVAEPSVSGISDLKRIYTVVHHFQVKAVLCINKYDTNREKTMEIIEYAKAMEIPLVGVIPFDAQVPLAINEGKSILHHSCKATPFLEQVCENTLHELRDSNSSSKVVTS